MLASAPTSRPPIALGCPVTLNGPMPGRPIRPVARWTLIMALTLSVPAEDWFTPWLNRLTTRPVPANQSKNLATSAASRPQQAAVAAASGVCARARAIASAAPVVAFETYSSSNTPLPARCASNPVNRATSVPGASDKCRSAPSQVAVRRGSITTMRIPGRCSRAARMR